MKTLRECRANCQFARDFVKGLLMEPGQTDSLPYIEGEHR